MPWWSHDTHSFLTGLGFSSMWSSGCWGKKGKLPLRCSRFGGCIFLLRIAGFGVLVDFCVFFPQTVCPLTLSTHCPILPLSVVPLVHIGLTKTLLHWCFFPLCLSTLHYWAQAILFQHETVVQCGTILLDTLWYINLLHPIAEDREHWKLPAYESSSVLPLGRFLYQDPFCWTSSSRSFYDDLRGFSF